MWTGLVWLRIGTGGDFFFLISHFICNLYQYIQQMLQSRIQRHAEECTLDSRLEAKRNVG
jgi:hypothetical protein